MAFNGFDSNLFASDFIVDFPSPLQPFTKEPVTSTIADYFKESALKVKWHLVGRDAIYSEHVGLPADHVMLHHVLDP